MFDGVVDKIELIELKIYFDIFGVDFKILEKI